MTEIVYLHREAKITPIFLKSDFFKIIKIIKMAIVSRIVKEEHWKRYVKIHNLVKCDKLDVSVFMEQAKKHRDLHHLQVMKSLSKSGWNPQIKIIDKENFEKIFIKNKGVVFWVDHFCYASITAKKAIYSICNDYYHVTRPEHGFSKSKFGIKILNPLRCYVEDRYLKGRIIIHREFPKKTRESISKILEKNGCISITAGAWEGRKIIKGDFLGKNFSLAAGAASAAFHNQTSIVPVFAYELNREQSVYFGKPISPFKGETCDSFTLRAFEEFCVQSSHHVECAPGQWRGWSRLE